ncbi:hypothetical protein D9615_004904 [Tricholomella constricta]|uniref:Shikimate dehydrogenase substrate binding N-terminal domain-containing protein n=1 Tax=Tricholomella constricta TaxID=117010 RepID=A0A8H5M788_9AGAR|nr:hypothetical protein D9615_004904 [Tricholomella constricta]
MNPLKAPPEGKIFYLFGYPVAHSAAPALHNLCFANWSQQTPLNTYEIWSTSKVTDAVIQTLSRDDCGGSAVTMPIKAAIIPFLDEVSPESRITGACNTIVKVPTNSGYKLVGQNTDILGVRNALLRALRSQFPRMEIPSEASYPSYLGAGGVIIGGGATSRSSAHALTLLGLTPLFLVNRDRAEVRAVQESLPHLDIIHLQSPDDVETYLGQPDSVKVLMVVGAIPSTPPATPQERLVYSIVSTVLTIPYLKPEAPSEGLPIPERRIFLEMAVQTMLALLAQPWRMDGMVSMVSRHVPRSRTSNFVNSVYYKAMIEQGLAQQRMWYMSSPTLQVGSDERIFGPELEQSVRELCENMGDVVVSGEEVDKAMGKDSATQPYARRSAL